MRMTEVPKIYPREDWVNETAEGLKNGNPRASFEILLALAGVSGSYSKYPISDNHYKIVSDAVKSFWERDYSEAIDVVNSLEQIIDHYKELAESYLDIINSYAIPNDGYTETGYPFVLTEDGEEKLGRVEILEISEHDLDDIWSGYIRKFLPFATDSEKEYISEKFSEQIKKEYND